MNYSKNEGRRFVSDKLRATRQRKNVARNDGHKAGKWGDDEGNKGFIGKNSSRRDFGWLDQRGRIKFWKRCKFRASRRNAIEFPELLTRQKRSE